MIAGIGLVALALSVTAPPQAVHLEAENGKLAGTTVATTRQGYTGTGYVTGFQKDGDTVVLTAQARAGLYEARIRYSAPTGEKGYVLVVNGSKVSGMFAATGDAFAVCAAGKVELKDGLNTIAFEKGWGYYDVDAIDFVPAAVPPKPRRLPAAPVDPKATPRARALWRFLAGEYGRKTLSGQYAADDCERIRAASGKMPAIRGGDFMDYSPSRLPFGADAAGTTEKLIDAAKAGQIVTMSWHWNAPKDLIDKTYKNARGETIEAPWYRGFYTFATTFDLRHALDNPDSGDYRLLLRDIDAIAVQLKKFADADVPVLWRPLHEAEGGWFWWGAKGPQAYIRLWRLMFDRLTGAHNLHNLIWVHNCVSPDWYPGDAYVDVVGVDGYPSDISDPLSGTWEDLIKRFDGRKLLAVTEFGGVPDVAKMHRFGARWAYFVSWDGTIQRIPKETLHRLYNAPGVLSEDELKLPTARHGTLTPSTARADRHSPSTRPTDNRSPATDYCS